MFPIWENRLEPRSTLAGDAPCDSCSCIVSILLEGGVSYLAVKVGGTWPRPRVGRREAHSYGHRAAFDGPAEGHSLAVCTAICANGLVYMMEDSSANQAAAVAPQGPAPGFPWH